MTEDQALGLVLAELQRELDLPNPDPLRCAMLEAWHDSCRAFIKYQQNPGSLVLYAGMIIYTQSMASGKPAEALTTVAYEYACALRAAKDAEAKGTNIS